MQQRRPTSEERPQFTMPARAVRPQHQPTRTSTARPPSAPTRHPNRTRMLPPQKQRSGGKWWLIAPIAALLVMMAAACAALTLGVGLIYARGILPGVSAAGVSLGGMTESEAARTLATAWDSITLRDSQRTWQFDPAELGMSIDGEATARAAHAQGRSQGNPVQALLGAVEIAPHLNIDMNTAAAALDSLAPQFRVEPVNAGIEFVGGDVRATPPRDGRALNTSALITLLQTDLAGALADGVLELPMVSLSPQITDSTPMIAQARALLANPLRIMAFDPVRGSTDELRVPPGEWSQWLTATASANGGLSLAFDEAALGAYFSQMNSELGAVRTLNLNESIQAMQQTISRGLTDATIRIYYNDTQHTVRSGETITSIAWDYGVPYPWIQTANPGVGDTVSIGQAITIPSPDNFFEFPPVPHKRIIVSLSEQRTRVYENGQLKWDWIVSTGIRDSPTWPGVYQIILHDPNAYAANWNLHMPWFLGVYRPVPGAAFTNGFHGFPTRGGSQIIWTNSLGTRVTYGCILLSSDNARLLYDWAEEGVVVEIVA